MHTPEYSLRKDFQHEANTVSKLVCIWCMHVYLSVRMEENFNLFCIFKINYWFKSAEQLLQFHFPWFPVFGSFRFFSVFFALTVAIPSITASMFAMIIFFKATTNHLILFWNLVSLLSGILCPFRASFFSRVAIGLYKPDDSVWLVTK